MSEFIHILQTRVPIGWAVLVFLLGVLLGLELWRQYRWWRLGRIVRAAALKAINAPDGTVTRLPALTEEERVYFMQKYDELVKSDKCGRKIDLK